MDENPDQATQDAIALLARSCPRRDCGAMIERAEGCAHMTCSICKYHHCWCCGAEWNRIQIRGARNHLRNCVMWRDSDNFEFFLEDVQQRYGLRRDENQPNITMRDWVRIHHKDPLIIDLTGLDESSDEEEEEMPRHRVPTPATEGMTVTVIPQIPWRV
ncbi:hypothetical protein ACMFMG_007787 [Clarireedia jacksonii]